MINLKWKILLVRYATNLSSEKHVRWIWRRKKTCFAFFLSDDFKTLDYNSYTNNAQMGVKWTLYPDQQSGPCQTKSVLKLLPPEGAEGAQISLTFADEAQGWVFNLGDSPHNNGYGKFHHIRKRPVHRGRLRNNHCLLT